MEGRGKGDAHVPLTKVAFDTVFSNVLCTVASCGCSRSLLLLLAGEGAAAAVVTRDLLQQVYCELVNFSYGALAQLMMTLVAPLLRKAE